MAAFIMDHPSSIRLNLPFSLTQTAPPSPPTPLKKRNNKKSDYVEMTTPFDNGSLLRYVAQ